MRWLALLLLLAAAPEDIRHEMRLLQAEPRANQLMSGSGVAFALRFSTPIDHQASRFMLVGPGGTERTVPVRLQSQPNVLYGSVGQLAPGGYLLRWTAHGTDGKALAGDLPFQVAP